MVSKSRKIFFPCLQFQKNEGKKFPISALASQKWLTNKPNYVHENLQGRNPIFVAILENQCLHKFILSFSNL